MTLTVCLGLFYCFWINLQPIRHFPDGIAWWISICLHFSALRTPLILTLISKSIWRNLVPNMQGTFTFTYHTTLQPFLLIQPNISHFDSVVHLLPFFHTPVPIFFLPSRVAFKTSMKTTSGQTSGRLLSTSSLMMALLNNLQRLRRSRSWSLFPLSCAHAQLRTADTVSAHKKIQRRTKKNSTAHKKNPTWIENKINT